MPWSRARDSEIACYQRDARTHALIVHVHMPLTVEQSLNYMRHDATAHTTCMDTLLCISDNDGLGLTAPFPPEGDATHN